MNRHKQNRAIICIMACVIHTFCNYCRSKKKISNECDMYVICNCFGSLIGQIYSDFHLFYPCPIFLPIYLRPIIPSNVFFVRIPAEFAAFTFSQIHFAKVPIHLTPTLLRFGAKQIVLSSSRWQSIQKKEKSYVTLSQYLLYKNR